MANRDTVLHQGDHLLIVCASDEADAIVTFIGSQVKADKEFDQGHYPLVSKWILVTEEDVNGKTLSQMSLSGKFGVNATRIYRAGVELLARPAQRLQVGDRIRVVEPSDAVDRLAARLGNSHNQLTIRTYSQSSSASSSESFSEFFLSQCSSGSLLHKCLS